MVRLLTGLAFALIGIVMGASGTILAADLPISRQLALGPAAPTPIPTATPTPTPRPTPVPKAPAVSALGPSAEIAPATFAPLRTLKIPAAGVNAHIEDVATTSTGAMDVPRSTRDVAWYDQGPVPGLPGDAVIDGHLDWYSGPAVFWNLNKLKRGDRIEVDYAGGARVSFRVTKTATYPYSQTPPGLFVATGSPRLSLITCAGTWDGTKYLQRLVITAVLIH